MLSAAIHQIAEDLKQDKPEQISTLDDELSDIFTSLFDSGSTLDSIASLKNAKTSSITTEFKQDPVDYSNIWIIDEADPATAFTRFDALNPGYELDILQNIKLPGIQRTLMPPVPEKSKRLWDFEKTRIYPFATLPIDELERGLVFEAIWDKMNEKEPDFQWDFFD